MQNIVMVGAGGTGTHLLKPLVTYLQSKYPQGDWMLHVVDGDIVEYKNLERQLFRPSDIQTNKAEAAVAPYDTGHVRAIPNYLSETNINKVIRDEDIVLVCVDNFTVRKRIEDHCLTLDNIVVINGGNEEWSGSVQIWIRKQGENVTPRIGYLHPEVNAEGADRAEMTCVQAAALPGGAQTIVANAQSAAWMLTALWRYQENLYANVNLDHPGPLTWTELQFDALNGTVDHIDQRMSSNWRTG